MLKDNSKTQNILILDNKSINELYLDEVKKIIEAEHFRVDRVIGRYDEMINEQVTVR